MSLPRDSLKQQGYYFVGDARCRRCGRSIEWWETPAGKKQPRDPATLVPHFATCGLPAKAGQAGAPIQLEMLHRDDDEELLHRMGIRL